MATRTRWLLAWSLTAAVALAIAAGARGQTGERPLQKIFGTGAGKSSPAPANATVAEKSQRRAEIGVELAWLADPITFPYFLEARIEGGTLAVISYHSGEDRLVKGAFRAWEQGCICPPGLPQCICGNKPLGTAEPRKAIIPLAAEIAGNPRARSAKLRFFRVHHAG